MGSIKKPARPAPPKATGPRTAASRLAIADWPAVEPDEWEGACLASLLEYSQDAIVSLTLDGIMRSWNPGAQRLLGYTAAEAVGQPVSILVPEDRRAEPHLLFAILDRGERVPPFETIRRRKDGSLINVELTLSPIVEGHRRIGVVTMVKDISDRKRAEQALRVREERFALAEKATNDGVWDWSPMTHGLYVSPRWKALLDFDEDELADHDDAFFQRLHPEDAPLVREAVRLHLEENQTYNIDLRLRRKDGSYRWFNSRGEAIRDEKGRPTRMVGTISDITVRKQMEDALRDSEQRFRRYFELGLIGIALTSPTMEWLEANDKLCEIFGYKRSELVKLTWAELTHPDDLAAEVANSDRVLAGETEGYAMEKRFIRRDGTVIHASISVKCLRRPGGAVDYFVALVQDITDRKHAEHELFESEARLRAIFDQTAAGIVQTDLNGRIIFANPRFCHTVGYSAAELLERSMRDITHPGDLAGSLDKFRKAAATGVGFDLEKRYRHKNGSPVWVHNSVSAIVNTTGEPQSILAVSVDITARKHAEEALHESGERLRLAIDAAKMGSWDWDMRTGAIRWSPYHEILFGYEPGTPDRTYADFQERLHPGDVKRLDAALRESIEKRRDFQCEYRVVWPDGSVHWVSGFGRFHFDSEGRPIRMLGMIEEITGRKRAEAALLQSHDLLAKLSRQVPGVIYQFQLFPDGRSCFPYASEGIREIYEVTPEQVREDASAVFALLHRDDYDGIVASIQKSARTLKPWHYEFRVVLPKQGVRWRLGDSVPERLPDGSTLWHGFITDITDRKRVQDALLASERQLSAIYANVSGIIFSLAVEPGGKFRFVSVNRAFLQATGLDEKQVLGKLAQDVIPKASRALVLCKYREAVRTRKVVRWEEVSHYPAGEKHGEVSVTPIMDATGKVTNLIGNVQNVTLRKNAEAALHKLNDELSTSVAERTASLLTSTESLLTSITELRAERDERRRLEKEVIDISTAERERIGRDLHDDLGQQLAGMRWLSSTLARKLKTRSSPEAPEAARISELLDGALALTRNLARGLHPVPSEPGGLMAALGRLAGQSSELFKVRCRFNCPCPVPLRDPAMATHLYRIAQEAVTNAVKHGAAKHIHIKLGFLASASSNGKILLAVTDNGKGIKKPGTKNEGLGVRIMRYRAEMLGGTLSFRKRPGGGTRMICAVPMPAQTPDERVTNATKPKRSRRG